jgi:mono/diheme cytochrome c family protein
MKNNIFFFILLLLVSNEKSFGQNTTASMENGKSIYSTYCMSCHMEDGNGLEGVYPSLVKTSSLADKNRLVKIITQGIRGPIDVKGVHYDAEMAGMEMSDQDVADVINYIRNTWGNKSSLIKASEVAPAKKAVVKGYQPY